MQTVAIAWHVYHLTHSPFSLGLVGIFGFIPMLFAFLPGGVIADSFYRKNILIFTQITLGALALILAISSYTHITSPVIIYAVLSIAALIITVDLPTRNAIIPSLVPKEDLLEAVNLNTITRQISLVLGPAIAGIMIASFGVSSVYLTNSVSFFILLFAILAVNIPLNETSKSNIDLKSVKEGVNFIFSAPLIFLTMLLDFLVTFAASTTILFPVFANDILKIPVSQLGFLYSAPAVGAVTAGFGISWFRNFKNQGKVLFLAIAIYSISTIIFGLSKSFPLSLAALFFVGVGDMISTVIRNAIRQLATPDNFRGRMSSIAMIFFIGGPFLGDAESGFLAGFIGAPYSIAIGGFAALTTSLIVGLKSSILRNYQGHELLD